MLKKKYSKSEPTCKVTFALPKEAIEEAIEVKILGDFNNWNPESGIPMKQVGGTFQAIIELPTGIDHQFRYLADNGIWENDWAADTYVETPFGVCNSVVVLSETVAKKTKSKKAKTKSDSTPAAAKVKAKITSDTSKAKKVVKDDLKKIEGIGPKIAELLNGAGIHTFADLSKAKQTTLKAILESGGSRYKMHSPTTWPNQAYLAAKGAWKELEQLQEELIGGKERK